MNKTNPPISDKSLARKIVQENISSMSQEEKRKASEKISQYLESIIETLKPKTLVLYNPLSDEVDISILWSWFWYRGNVVTVTQEGLFESFENSKNTLAIIPWRAFTQEWKRVGRWSGYYDQFLETHSNIQTLWVCFECQLFEDLPENAWDKRISQVVFG